MSKIRMKEDTGIVYSVRKDLLLKINQPPEKKKTMNKAVFFM